ncbi:MAG TPA: NRDE family protein [Moraxellaceae bacterium]|nr:NRDE family protein [Moraxellaceae bacterium]
MCLIALAWQAHPDYPLIVAANRDEFHARGAAPARFWPEAPWLLAGRDLDAGGTWMGVTRCGRFAALTNFREPLAAKGARSRGLLVSEYLLSCVDPLAYAEKVRAEGAHYSGFNLLVSDGERLVALSNRGMAPTVLPPGVYGLSNHLLDTPWPKVRRAREALQVLTGSPSVEGLLHLLADDAAAPDEELPDTGVGPVLERLLSSPFIRSAAYGTRASTALLAGRTRIRFVEQSFRPEGPGERSDFEFDRVSPDRVASDRVSRDQVASGGADPGQGTPDGSR